MFIRFLKIQLKINPQIFSVEAMSLFFFFSRNVLISHKKVEDSEVVIEIFLTEKEKSGQVIYLI